MGPCALEAFLTRRIPAVLQGRDRDLSKGMAEQAKEQPVAPAPPSSDTSSAPRTQQLVNLFLAIWQMVA